MILQQLIKTEKMNLNKKLTNLMQTPRL
jgi:hypothetical protein